MPKIYKYPAKILLKTATEVADMREARYIISELKLACQAQTWGQVVGMAAPQIGISKRVFLALNRPYINPEIIEAYGWRICSEGCYSLEDNKYDYQFSRPNLIVLKWQEYSGEWLTARFSGFEAQVIHHEFDHLEGKLINGENND